MVRCKICNNEKELESCHDCYFEMLCKYMNAGSNSSVAQLLKYEIHDEIKEVLQPLLIRIERIEEILRIKKEKRK